MIQLHWNVIASEGGTKGSKTAAPRGPDGAVTLACGAQYILEVKCHNQSKVRATAWTSRAIL